MGDSCAFCLAALGTGGGTLVLPCGHAFHSTCALQFLLSESEGIASRPAPRPPPAPHRRHCPPLSPLLLERKQCIVCRAPVDESRVLDASQLPPEASGRQFVPPCPPPAGQQAAGGKAGGGSGGPQIELRAFAGSSAAAAAAAWPQPQVPASPAAEYQPDYLSPSPRIGTGSPPPLLGVIVEGAPAAPQPATQPPAQPLRTITVVRPSRWPRRLALAAMALALLALLVVVPVVLSRAGEGQAGWRLGVGPGCTAEPGRLMVTGLAHAANRPVRCAPPLQATAHPALQGPQKPSARGASCGEMTPGGSAQQSASTTGQTPSSQRMTGSGRCWAGTRQWRRCAD